MKKLYIIFFACCFLGNVSIVTATKVNKNIKKFFSKKVINGLKGLVDYDNDGKIEFDDFVGKLDGLCKDGGVQKVVEKLGEIDFEAKDFCKKLNLAFDNTKGKDFLSTFKDFGKNQINRYIGDTKSYKYIYRGLNKVAKGEIGRFLLDNHQSALDNFGVAQKFLQKAIEGNELYFGTMAKNFEEVMKFVDPKTSRLSERVIPKVIERIKLLDANKAHLDSIIKKLKEKSEADSVRALIVFKSKMSEKIDDFKRDVIVDKSKCSKYFSILTKVAPLFKECLTIGQSTPENQE